MANERVPLKPVRDLRDLVAWQVAMDIAVLIHEVSRGFPSEERFGLQAQIRKAAVSIASNVAEGHGRASRAEYAYFVGVARGSLKEVETQMELAKRFGYPVEQSLASFGELAHRLNGLLTALRLKLRCSK